MKSISIIAIFFVLIVCVVAENKEFLDRFKRTMNECKTETRASETDVKDLLKHSPAKTRRAKCFRACIVSKFGVINKNGRMNKPAFLKIIKEIARGDEKLIKKGEKVIDACKDLRVPRDRCESTRLYVACLREESKKQETKFVFIWGPEL